MPSCSSSAFAVNAGCRAFRSLLWVALSCVLRRFGADQIKLAKRDSIVPFLVNMGWPGGGLWMALRASSVANESSLGPTLTTGPRFESSVRWAFLSSDLITTSESYRILHARLQCHYCAGGHLQSSLARTLHCFSLVTGMY